MMCQRLRDKERCASLRTCQKFRLPVQRKNLPSLQAKVPRFHGSSYVYLYIYMHFIVSYHSPLFFIHACGRYFIFSPSIYINTVLTWYQIAAQICSLLYKPRSPVSELSSDSNITRRHHQPGALHTLVPAFVLWPIHSFP